MITQLEHNALVLREYDPNIDGMEYVYYQPIPKLIYPQATTEDWQQFRFAFATAKQHFMSPRYQKMNQGKSMLAGIRTVIAQQPELATWCANKSIPLDAYQHTVDLPEISNLLFMITQSGAQVHPDSIDILLNFLETTKFPLEGIKLNVPLTIYAKKLSTISMKPTIELFFAALTDESFMNSADFFHSCCANELYFLAELFIKELLKRKTSCQNAFFQLRDAENKTPLIAACLYGMNKTITMIIQCAEAEPDKTFNIQSNAIDNFRSTALDYALGLGRIDIILGLLKVGARFSSDDILQTYTSNVLIDSMLRRAIICGTRHHKASTNYLYYENSTRHLPIMVKGISEPDTAWRFLVNHPSNLDAIAVIVENAGWVTEHCENDFKQLTTLDDRMTYKEKIIQNHSDVVFLKKFVQLLARLGLFSQVVILLQKHGANDLLHYENNLNLLHICTNSFNLTKQHSMMRDPSAIVAGRIELAAFLCTTYPALLEEKTSTSAGLQKFTEIVVRMYQKPQSGKKLLTKPADQVFNDELYSGLFQLCVQKKLISIDINPGVNLFVENKL